LISSESAIRCGTTSGYLYYSSPSYAYAGDQTAYSGGFPKGYAAVYIMKYEVSQGQYADFLNTPDFISASARYAGIYRDPPYYSGAIRLIPPPVRTGLVISFLGMIYAPMLIDGFKAFLRN
jgi:hypothetical protein